MHTSTDDYSESLQKLMRKTALTEGENNSKRAGGRPAAESAAFTIFEDETATRSANPIPEEVDNDPEYYKGFGGKDAPVSAEAAARFELYRLRQDVDRVMQREGYMFAMTAAHWMYPIAWQVDLCTPYTGQSFEERVRLWIFNQQCYYQYGPSWPRGEKQIEEQPWVTLEAIQELADIVAGLNHVVPPLVNVLQAQTGHTYCPTRLALIAGYCTGRGGGMIDEHPVLDLDDSKYWNDMLDAWAKIAKFYLGERKKYFKHSGMCALNGNWWREKVRRRVDECGNVNFGILDRYRGDTYPVSKYFRTFGQGVNAGNLQLRDPLARRMVVAGLDQHLWDSW
ncbi:hypothetical protein LZ554_006269 [Drepanopeziza brunnea f. sp. 'monogermtubi']|nr:hypothetical protein LZ554_006269 [Drepanopeziza brunnea f. sp. 'monogermtubi']